ncbi:MAG: heme NO-binding domain-containing protein, partial [Bdellovibrionales bacterium]|nr:heme NO-binding domain-containing protein [Bdellovibrionales bacterium]
KVFSDAQPPELTYIDAEPNKLTLNYRSKRKMYSFAHGLLEGMSEYFRVPIKIEKRIVDHAQGVCSFELTFDG